MEKKIFEGNDRIIKDIGKYKKNLPEMQKLVISIVGYGNQGRSQALNLRDSGFHVIIGNINDKYAETARQDGFEVYDIKDAVSKSQITFLLTPDEIQKELCKESITPFLKEEHTIVFASGYNYFYGYVEFPQFINVLMIAPRMIGWGVRDVYEKDLGFPVLMAVGKDYSGNAEKIAYSLCYGLGVFRKGGCAIRSSFREETLVDLLTEHSWAGAISFLFRAYYDVAVNLGASPEAVILELYGSGELAEIAESMKNMGLFEQLKTHSRTSQYGQLTRGPLYINKDFKDRLYNEALQILNGTFAREWTEEQATGMVVFKKLHEMAREHPMEAEERKLYKILGRLD